jgi:hypothetical protein
MKMPNVQEIPAKEPNYKAQPNRPALRKPGAPPRINKRVAHCRQQPATMTTLNENMTTGYDLWYYFDVSSNYSYLSSDVLPSRLTDDSDSDTDIQYRDDDMEPRSTTAVIAVKTTSFSKSRSRDDDDDVPICKYLISSIKFNQTFQLVLQLKSIVKIHYR